MPLMPGCVLCLNSPVRFYRDSLFLSLALAAAVQAEFAGVFNFRVSGVGFTARLSAFICVHRRLKILLLAELPQRVRFDIWDRG